ncbi:AAA family ATPase [Salinimicrobium sp. GXAS 041]|uniref:AAA family ATPase n=1 Tax=Salinimicrobium sp. GXAS 041 TaxID=3400806 RepID=UPI003C72BA86
MKKQIQLKELTLLNFKGIRNLTVKFDSKTTSIFADNGLGKTTIMDSFLWLLFGKDSQDRKDFEVKTLDRNNRPIPKIDHEVTAVIDVNGEEITLQRTLREKWVKKRGSRTPEFTGNETLYTWNEVPMQAKEYAAKINEILDEGIFKLITNPMAFNGLKWQDRREVLMGMCGEIDDAELAGKNADYNILVDKLSNKTLEELKKETTAKRKKINDALKMIPTRIDEVQRNMPEALDFSGIKKAIEKKQSEINEIEGQISNKSKALEKELEKRSQQQNKIHAVKSELSNIKYEVEQKAKNAGRVDYSTRDALQNSLTTKQDSLKEAQEGIEKLKTKKQSIEDSREALIKKWQDENAKELSFNDEDTHCPTCKREFEASVLEDKKAEMLENFENKKAKTLTEINTEGQSLNAEKEAIQGRIEKGEAIVKSLEPEIAELSTKLETEKERLSKLENSEKPDIDKLLSENEQYQAKQKELKTLEAELGEAPTVETSELKSKKDAVQKELDQLKKDLSLEESIKTSEKRIAELEQEEETLSGQLMELEGQEFTIENFIKLKIETLESKINSQFKIVNFKLFDVQINGGISETCEALIDGVPFSNANTASRVNGGLDIIETLCKYYGVTAPVWIDNAESVVNLIPIESQLIRLVVSEGDDKLRVESGKLETEKAAV